jgi:hypothetical protein
MCTGWCIPLLSWVLRARKELGEESERYGSKHLDQSAYTPESLGGVREFAIMLQSVTWCCLP